MLSLNGESSAILLTRHREPPRFNRRIPPRDSVHRGGSCPEASSMSSRPDFPDTRESLFRDSHSLRLGHLTANPLLAPSFKIVRVMRSGGKLCRSIEPVVPGPPRAEGLEATFIRNTQNISVRNSELWTWLGIWETLCAARIQSKQSQERRFIRL